MSSRDTISTSFKRWVQPGDRGTNTPIDFDAALYRFFNEQVVVLLVLLFQLRSTLSALFKFKQNFSAVFPKFFNIDPFNVKGHKEEFHRTFSRQGRPMHHTAAGLTVAWLAQHQLEHQQLASRLKSYRVSFIQLSPLSEMALGARARNGCFRQDPL